MSFYPKMQVDGGGGDGATGFPIAEFNQYLAISNEVPVPELIFRVSGLITHMGLNDTYEYVDSILRLFLSASDI